MSFDHRYLKRYLSLQESSTPKEGLIPPLTQEENIVYAYMSRFLSDIGFCEEWKEKDDNTKEYLIKEWLKITA